MSKADFALQWLDFLKVKIYNKGTRIWQYGGEYTYDIFPLNTRIKCGVELKEENEEIKFTEMSFSEFERLGYAVKSNMYIKWKPKQRAAYEIIRRTFNSVGISPVSFRMARLKLQHDAMNRRIRLIGENVISNPKLNKNSGVGKWICYDPDRPNKLKKKDVKLDKESAKHIMESMFTRVDLNKSVEYQPIEEIPILITDEKYIVCIPKMDICPRVLCTGAARHGKSTFINAFCGRVFYKWGDRVGWLIDPQNQFYDISLPQDFSGFTKILELIGEEPKPIPAVHLYLACKNKLPIEHDNISLKLTLNFYEFLNKYEYYSYGKNDWKIEGSERYLKDVLRKVGRRVENVQTVDGLNDIFYEQIPGASDEKHGKGMRSMIYKWTSSFTSIFKEKFTSNLYLNDSLATDKLKVVYNDGTEMEGHPFIMCMEAGIVPVINTSTLPESVWVRNYMGDLMDKILNHQKQMGKNAHRLMIAVDEMQSIYEEKSGKRKDNASMKSEQLFRQGGFQNIGYAGNTQSLEKLPYELVKNATHIACVYTQSKKERKIIGDTFDLKEVTDQLLDLKPQEMMIFSSLPFVVYDRWGSKKLVEDKKWFKGRIIPPINYHKKRINA